jgi:hypothetical protein
MRGLILLLAIFSTLGAAQSISINRVLLLIPKSELVEYQVIPTTPLADGYNRGRSYQLRLRGDNDSVHRVTLTVSVKRNTSHISRVRIYIDNQSDGGQKAFGYVAGLLLTGCLGFSDQNTQNIAGWLFGRIGEAQQNGSGEYQRTMGTAELRLGLGLDGIAAVVARHDSRGTSTWKRWCVL